ncbi:hypothetical protein SK128_006766 [Halocaridina rubra]|uniref:Uncharacterized protein n=1 Tax=Halocaridina rubra TaxID=373956 RepID=A0AAN8ZY80_HALRR
MTTEIEITEEEKCDDNEEERKNPNQKKEEEEEEKETAVDEERELDEYKELDKHENIPLLLCEEEVVLTKEMEEIILGPESFTRQDPYHAIGCRPWPDRMYFWPFLVWRGLASAFSFLIRLAPYPRWKRGLSSQALPRVTH